MSALPITVFSDFACPASYVTEAALWRLGQELDLEVRYRAFELFPEAGVPGELRFSAAEWDGLAELATTAGVSLSPRAVLPSSRKAHEAVQLARGRGVEEKMRREVYAAFWRDERDIGRIDVLADLGERVGIDPEDLRIALDIDSFRDQVLADEELGHRLRIPGTPVLYLGAGAAARIVTGARGVDEIRSLVQATTTD